MKKKILVLIFGLMCCSHIPNVRGMERIEETIYFDELTHQFTIRDIYLQKGDISDNYQSRISKQGGKKGNFVRF